MKKDLKNITQEEVEMICGFYGEPFISFYSDYSFGLAVSITTTSTTKNSNYDSSIAIWYDGRVTLSRNNGGWNGMITVDISPLIAIDYLRNLGYEFKYELPKKLERKMKISEINKIE